jgi:hypothetical protein
MCISPSTDAVQKKAEAELGERVGSIVVMDPRDNSVLALPLSRASTLMPSTAG